MPLFFSHAGTHTIHTRLQTLSEYSSDNGDFLFYLDTIVVVFFTIDYVGRLLTCPRLCKFLLSFLNFIDVVSIIPFYVEIGKCMLCLSVTPPVALLPPPPLLLPSPPPPPSLRPISPFCVLLWESPSGDAGGCQLPYISVE